MPKFTHDCDKCQFLGTEHGQDLYICAGEYMVPGLGPSIVARFGNNGPDYASMPWGAIEQALECSPVPEPIMAAVHIVEEIMVNTLRPRSSEFRQFLRHHGTPKMLAAVGAHANQVLHEELKMDGFPYDPAPFLAIRAEAILRDDGTVTFGLTAREA